MRRDHTVVSRESSVAGLNAGRAQACRGGVHGGGGRRVATAAPAGRGLGASPGGDTRSRGRSPRDLGPGPPTANCQGEFFDQLERLSSLRRPPVSRCAPRSGHRGAIAQSDTQVEEAIQAILSPKNPRPGRQSRRGKPRVAHSSLSEALRTQSGTSTIKPRRPYPDRTTNATSARAACGGSAADMGMHTDVRGRVCPTLSALSPSRASCARRPLKVARAQCAAPSRQAVMPFLHWRWRRRSQRIRA